MSENDKWMLFFGFLAFLGFLAWLKSQSTQPAVSLEEVRRIREGFGRRES